MTQCNVCQNDVKQPVYVSTGNLSITSLCQFYPQKTEVFFCEHCGHLQTTEITNLEEYYDTIYKILIDSEEEDQLYKVIDGQKIFRIDHQVKVLLDQVSLPQQAKILDYGCAKSATLKKLCQTRPDVIPHLFDVSEMYIPFWEKFVKSENWATYTIKPHWYGYFDLVTSFFALEHVANPKEMVENISQLLKPDGLCYLVIPNVYTNPADFVVVDHVNHFSETSLRFLLEEEGFDAIDIDAESHAGAFIVVARHSNSNDRKKVILDQQEKVTFCQKKVTEMAVYWQNIAEKILRFEEEHNNNLSSAIYGAGFYGAFMASCLKDIGKIECFIDRNPYLQGKLLLDKPILDPPHISNNIDTIYVALNPAIAVKSIEQIEFWKDRNFNYFYL
jgi:SAM-dependent methyltransferase